MEKANVKIEPGIAHTQLLQLGLVNAWKKHIVCVQL